MTLTDRTHQLCAGEKPRETKMASKFTCCEWCHGDGEICLRCELSETLCECDPEDQEIDACPDCEGVGLFPIEETKLEAGE